MEGVGQAVVAHVPLLGSAGDDLAIGIVVDQPFVDIVEDEAIGGQEVDLRIERTDGGADAAIEHGLRSRRRRNRACKRSAEQHDGCGSEQHILEWHDFLPLCFLWLAAGSDCARSPGRPRCHSAACRLRLSSRRRVYRTVASVPAPFAHLSYPDATTRLE